jgi:arylesterase/paraoxonase
MAGSWSRTGRNLVLALIIGPLVAFLAGRARVLSLSYYNAPGRMPLHTGFSSYAVRFQDRIRSCEDVLLVEDRRLALLACDPGRETWNTVMGLFLAEKPEPNAELYAFHYDRDGDDALARIELRGLDSELRTIGFELHEPSGTLLVTNHLRGGPRIEQFRLDLDALTATHLRSLAHPLINTPNSIAARSAEDFYVTNNHRYLPAAGRARWFLETYLAPPLATVVHARILPSGELDASVVARLAYPNGLAMLDGGRQVAVASTNSRAVHIYNVTGSGSGSGAEHPTLSLGHTIRDLPFLPDNVAVADDGALLIAGHPHVPSLNKFATSRHVCNRPEALAAGGPDAARMCDETKGASWAAEWTPEKGLVDIYSGWDYPTSASVVRNKAHGMGIVAGLYANGILVWKD